MLINVLSKSPIFILVFLNFSSLFAKVFIILAKLVYLFIFSVNKFLEK